MTGTNMNNLQMVKKINETSEQLEHTTKEHIKRESSIRNNIKNNYNIKLKEYEFNMDRLDFKTLLTPTTNTNNWYLESGVLKSNLSTINFAIFKNTMADGTIEITCLNPKIASWFGILVGYDDIKNNGLVVMIRNNQIEYWKIEGNLFKQLTLNSYNIANEVETKIVEGEPVHLKIERKGNIVATYVNDRLITNTEDVFFYKLKYKNGIVANTDTSFDFTNLLINEYLFNNSFKIDDGMCIGTSITYGINQGNKWVDLFREKIKENMMFSDSIILRNEGRSGWTSTQILGLLPTLYNNYKQTLEYINIEVGMNDLKNDNGITADDTIDNIRTMIRFCKQYNLYCTVTTITPLVEGFGGVGSDPVWVGGYKQYVETNNKIRKLCLLENIRCIDNAKAFGKLSMTEIKSIVSDGVHPNDGEIMAETAIKALIGEI